jgi:hypothetical protein
LLGAITYVTSTNAGFWKKSKGEEMEERELLCCSEKKEGSRETQLGLLDKVMKDIGRRKGFLV